MTERKALTYLEVDIDFCSLSYGVSPCTAEIGVTGDIKCFNSPGSCQDRANFTNAPVTLRFAKAADYRPLGIEALPTILSVDFSPAELKPGEDLGTRASLTVTFKDHPHSDTGPGFDPYRTERAYDPYSQGSFWAKFRARQPFLKGESIRWIQGFLGDDIADMETRHFVVESFNGPTPEGVFTIVAKDPLKLVDGSRANAPFASTGSLIASIDASTASATLSPVGIGDEEYPASGYLNIGGKEVVSFTRSGDTLTLTRGQENTTGVAHDQGERCQLCLDYSAEDPAEIIYDLLVNYGGLDPSWCDLSAWQEETDNYLRRNYSGFIAEPTSVNQLVAELMEQAGLTIWWDDLTPAVRLQVLRAITTDEVLYDEGLIRKDRNRFGLREQPNKRVSQVWCFFAQNNPLKDLEDKDNYRQVEVTVDLDNETDYGQPSIKKIWSRWIPLGGAITAQRANNLQLGRYLTPPRRFTFSLFRGAQADPQLGGGCVIEHRVLQDATGATEQVPAQIVRCKPAPDGWDIDAEEMRFVSLDEGDLDNHVIVLAGVQTGPFSIVDLHDQLYPAAQAGDTVTVIIQPGAVIGSTSASSYALRVSSLTGNDPFPSTSMSGTRTSGSAVITGLSDTSDFAEGMRVIGTGIPAGAKIASVDSGTQITLDANATSSGTSTLTIYLVILTITNNGRIIGRGGNGGRGSYRVHNGRTNAQNGFAGGPALLIDYPCDLDNTNGDIWGGGGGGGGAGVLNLDQHTGGPGGGGAGYIAGASGPTQVGYGGSTPCTTGAAGTQTTGGIGGNSYASFSWSQPPFFTGVRGGSGGGPGIAGGAGSHHGGQGFEQQVGAGGAAGISIQGVSLIVNLGTGDVRGSTAG